MSTSCEVCGSPATVAVRYHKEGQPVEDDKGRLWTTHEPDGPAHHWCESCHDQHCLQTFNYAAALGGCNPVQRLDKPDPQLQKLLRGCNEVLMPHVPPQ